MLFKFQSRDTWIYAAGNETDDVTNFLKELPKLKVRVTFTIRTTFEKLQGTNEHFDFIINHQTFRMIEVRQSIDPRRLKCSLFVEGSNQGLPLCS